MMVALSNPPDLKHEGGNSRLHAGRGRLLMIGHMLRFADYSVDTP